MRTIQYYSNEGTYRLVSRILSRPFRFRSDSDGISVNVYVKYMMDEELTQIQQQCGLSVNAIGLSYPDGDTVNFSFVRGKL